MDKVSIETIGFLPCSLGLGSLNRASLMLPSPFLPLRAHHLLQFSRAKGYLVVLLLSHPPPIWCPSRRVDKGPCMSSYVLSQKEASNSQLRTPGDTAVFLLCNFLLSPSKIYSPPPIFFCLEKNKEERGYVSAKLRSHDFSNSLVPARCLLLPSSAIC